VRACSAARACESANRIGTVIEIKNMGDQLHFSTRQSSCIISLALARFRPRFPASLNGIAAGARRALPLAIGAARIGAFKCVILGRQRGAQHIIINMLCASVYGMAQYTQGTSSLSCIDMLRRAHYRCCRLRCVFALSPSTLRANQ
jgi:hypothetical protein